MTGSLLQSPEQSEQQSSQKEAKSITRRQTGVLQCKDHADMRRDQIERNEFISALLILSLSSHKVHSLFSTPTQGDHGSPFLGKRLQKTNYCTGRSNNPLAKNKQKRLDGILSNVQD